MLEHATSLSPSNASLYYMLGHYYEALGKRALAAKALGTYNDLKSEQEKEYDAGRP
jgi:Flp pilus assembly protein TadD